MAEGGFYVQVIGPMDSVFTGPFETREAAAAWSERLDTTRFDGYVMTHAKMMENMVEFGEVPIQAPDSLED
jgi:hypothetical protein